MAHRHLITALCFVSLGVLFGGCSGAGDAQDEFEEAAAAPPDGYTTVDAEGQIGEVDEDDWRTGPAYAGIVVNPPYPNPVVDERVILEVTIYAGDRIRGRLDLRAYVDGYLLSLDQPKEGQTGIVSFTFHSNLLGTAGLHRLYLFDSQGGIVSYGDILVQ